MNKKIILLLVILLIPLGIWLNNLLTVIDSDNYNDRMAVNNQIVGVINRLQDQMREPQILLEQFIDLSELSESEQRATWKLLELIKIDFSHEIRSAEDEIAKINLEENSDLYELQQKALALIDSYKAYTPTYQTITETLKTEKLSSAEIEALINNEMNGVAEATSEAANAFMTAQEAMLKGS